MMARSETKLSTVSGRLCRLITLSTGGAPAQPQRDIVYSLLVNVGRRFWNPLLSISSSAHGQPLPPTHLNIHRHVFTFMYTPLPLAGKLTTCSDESCPAKAMDDPDGDHATLCTHPWHPNSAYTSPSASSWRQFQPQ
jgi:hypothetical protein